MCRSYYKSFEEAIFLFGFLPVPVTLTGWLFSRLPNNITNSKADPLQMLQIKI